MKISLEVDEKSIVNVIENLQQKQLSVETAAYLGIRNITEEIFEEAQKIVPVDTGALKDSGLTQVNQQVNQVESVISYGSSGIGRHGVSTSVYAPIRHEMRSKKNPEGYKWLEKTLLSSSNKFYEELSKLIREALNEK